MVITTAVRTAALLLLVTACGYKGPVSRIDMDRTDIPREELKAMQKTEREMVEKKLTPQPQARPQRVDDIVAKPAPREDDPFDLPPQ